MNQATIEIDVDRLRELIGTEVHYNNMACRIIEVLDDGPALVLQYNDPTPHIQADQHGEAHRKVPTTTTIEVLDQDGQTFSQAFKALKLRGFF